MMHLLEMHGFKAFDLTQSPISGGSLVIYFSKNKKEQSSVLKVAIQTELLKKTNELQTWKDFANACEKHATELKETVIKHKKNGAVIGYGASARSSTMLNYAGLNSDVIDCVIDKNPLKLGRYTPGTNIPIISFEQGKRLFDKCGSILLLAWNFEKEIVNELRENGYKGTIIVPLPNTIHLNDI